VRKGRLVNVITASLNKYRTDDQRVSAKKLSLG